MTNKSAILMLLRSKFGLTYLWLIFIQFISAASAYGQSLYVDRIGLNEGLSQATITAIAQDSKGFMWFATQSSLDRYDGYEFKAYKNIPDDPNSISNSITWALMVDQDGQVWAGTYGGLNRYDADTDRFVSYQHDPGDPNSLSHNNIWSLLQDQQGTIWVGTGRGLNRFNKESEQFTRFLNTPSSKYSLSNNVVNALYQDSSGDLWVGTDRGLNRFDLQQQQFERINDANSILTSSIVSSITEDAQGRLWVGTDGHGVFVLDQERKSIAHKKYDPAKSDSISANKIRVIFKDSKDRLWIGTDNGGLNRYDESKDGFIHYLHNPSDPHSLSENVIYSIFEDKTSILWIGTYTKGLSKFSPYGFSSSIEVEYPSLENPDPHTDIRGFQIDKSGALWIVSSSNGIRVTDINGNKKSFRHSPENVSSISSDKIYSIYEDSTGTIWAGAVNGWLNEYRREEESFIRHQIQPDTPGSIRHGKIVIMKEDHEGLLWVGLERGGLHSFDRNTRQFTHYHHDPDDNGTIRNDRVYGIYVDSNDNIWVGTFGGGLNKYDKGLKKFTSYPAVSGHDNIPNVNLIHKDINRDVFWLGTYGEGIYQFDLQTLTFKHFGKKDGLVDEMIYAILQDKKNQLWISHDKGISCFNLEDMSFRNYDQRDGLQSNEFNGGTYYESNDGKFFFGGINGYNAFYPHEVINNPNPPPVYITEFQLFNQVITNNTEYDGRILLNKPILELDELTLSHKDYVFSFEFSALDYVYSSKNRYAYKMEGLEENWNYVDSKRRFATYTTLPPGSYTFRVKASNNDGVWNEQGASLAIIITPPFWQSWWFRVMLGLIVVVCVYTIYRLRIKAIHIRNKLLKEQVKERTADLEETLYELVQTKDAFEESSKVATGALHNVGNLLNSVNTSIAVIQKMIYESVIKKFIKANEVLRENIGNLEEFITEGDKGKKLMNYYLGMEKSILEEQDELNKNVLRSIEKISAIKEAISAQQRSAKGQGFVEKLSLRSLIDETIMLQSGSPDGRGMRFDKCYGSVPDIKIEKAKLVQVLLNLYKNAKESMDEANSENKVITIELAKDEENAYIKVSDNGLGIGPKKLKKMFSYGFTTKTSGHGFGLHSSANYMEGMGGSISVVSDGIGKGATFILKLPLQGVQMDRGSINKTHLKVVGG